MPFIFIDRRKAGRGKSSPNRQKLIRRIKSFIKNSQPNNIGAGGVAGSSAKSSSPVKVAGQALDEPWFAYSREGEHSIVIIGNDEYDRGDEIHLPEEDEGSGGAGPGESGEDEFIVNVARDEFLDLFYEDCELPNLTNEKFTERLDNKFQQSGFSTTGNPSQLSIIRSYKQMIGRRRALSTPYRKELEELELELKSIYDELNSSAPEDMLIQKHSSRIDEIEARILVLHRKIAAIEGFDKTDLRFRKKEAKPLKTVDAVLIMVMDISGSMDENKKTIARRWFALLYAFIKRRYNNTELLFIAHTDEAFEMSESDFFSTRVNGGTSVSPALKMINQIIKERYDPNQTNIYISHASDGDNWENDNSLVIDEMVGEGNLLKKVQYFSYVEVGKVINSTWHSIVSGRDDTSLWKAYVASRDRSPKNMSLAIIESADDCYSVFKKVFRKDKK